MSNKLTSILLLAAVVLLAAVLLQLRSLDRRMDLVSRKVGDVAWSLATLSMTLNDSLESLRDDSLDIRQTLQEVEARDGLASFDLCLARSEVLRLGGMLAPDQYPDDPPPCIPPLPDVELTLP